VCHFIRIITKDHLTELRSVLGNQLGIGIKKRFPPRGGRELHCLHGDDIHLIIIDETSFQSAGYRKGKRYLLRINQHGFDFKFEPGIHSLIIECRFNSVRATDKVVRDLVSYQASHQSA